MNTALVLFVLSTWVQPSVELDYNPPVEVRFVGADIGYNPPQCNVLYEFLSNDGLCHLNSDGSVAPERSTPELKRR
jgi:hypothetical protein